MDVLLADLPLHRRIPDDDVGIGAGYDRALARVEAEDASRIVASTFARVPIGTPRRSPSERIIGSLISTPAMPYGSSFEVARLVLDRVGCEPARDRSPRCRSRRR